MGDEDTVSMDILQTIGYNIGSATTRDVTSNTKPKTVTIDTMVSDDKDYVARSDVLEAMEILEHCTVVKRYGLQKDAQICGEKNGTLMLSEDKVSAGAGKKRFYSAGVDQLWTQMYYPREPKSRCMYEMVRAPCHFYVDMECYPSHNLEMLPYGDLRAMLILDILCQFVKQYHGKPYASDNPDRCFRVTQVEVFESDASRAGKISRHYTFRVAGAMFASNKHCGAFQRCMLSDALRTRGGVESNPLFLWSDNNNNVDRSDPQKYKIPICDHGVYTRRRSMRLLYSSKGGQWRPLVPYRRWTATYNADSGVWSNVAGDNVECSVDYTNGTGVPDKDTFTVNRDVFETSLLQYLRQNELAQLPVDGLYVMRCDEPDGSPALFTSALITQPGYLKRTGQRNQTARRVWTSDAYASMLRDSANVSSAHAQYMQRAFERVHQVGHGSDADIKRALSEWAATSTEGGTASSVAQDYIIPQEPIEFPKLRASDIDAMLHYTEHDGAGGRSVSNMAQRLCILMGETIHRHTGIAEQLRYYHIMPGCTTFLYQFDSRYCPIAGREHSGNHIRIVVRLDPNGVLAQNNGDDGDGQSDAPIFNEAALQEMIECYGEEEAMAMMGGDSASDNDVLATFHYLCYTCAERRTIPSPFPFEAIDGGDILIDHVHDLFAAMQSRRSVTLPTLLDALLAVARVPTSAVMSQ